MKEFTCPQDGCESKNFTMIQRRLTEVDFSQEGGVEGHPFLGSASVNFEGFICFECGGEVPRDMAQEMLREVV